MKKNQSKYFFTSKLMNEALLSLLEKKPFDFITVTDITKKAGVNRSTFYLHYENIDDLLSECIEYVGNKINKKFSDRVINKQVINDSQLEDLLLITPKYLLPYLEFLKENKAIYKIAYSQPNVLKEKHVVNHLYKNIFEPILNRFLIPKNEQKYIMSFYLSGMGALMMEWVKNDCKEDPQNIVDILIRCVNFK